MKYFILQILLLATIPLYSQGIAEVIYNDYWKIGVYGSISNYSSFGENNPIDYKEFDIQMKEIGLVWNFYQWKNNNLKIGISKPLSYWSSRSFNISNEDIPDIYDFDMSTDMQLGNKQIKGHFTYERFFRVNNYLFLSPGAGLELLYFPPYYGSGAFSIGDEENNLLQRYESNFDRVHDLNVGLRAEIGLHIKSNIGLFNIHAHGVFAFNDFTQTTLKTMNLITVPNTTTHHGIKGHNIGFGLRFYPKRKKK